MLNFLITNTDLEEIILGATVSSTTAEYSRSTMVEDRLDDLSLMHIHRDHQIDLDRIIQQFAAEESDYLVIFPY